MAMAVANAVKLKDDDDTRGEKLAQTTFQSSADAYAETEASTVAVAQVKAQAEVEAQTGVEAEVGAEAEAGFIKLLMKPFFGPIIDLFMDMVLHKPWVVNLGGSKTSDDELSCYYDSWKPDTTIVTDKKKPKVFNFGHEPKP